MAHTLVQKADKDVLRAAAGGGSFLIQPDRDR